MQDAAVLADLLSENLSDIDSALFKFSERRVPEGHALLDLSVTASTPKAAHLQLAYLIINGFESFGHKLLPTIIAPPTQNLLTQSSLSMDEIYRSKKWFLDIVKASNEELGVFSGFETEE